MRQQRGVSQILFGFLPLQTADLSGGVWRVVKWVDAVPLAVDQEAVRAAVRTAVSRWAVAGQDGGLFSELTRRVDFDVIRVNVDRGVLMDEFPRLWRCRSCGRVSRAAARCRCGASESLVQLPLVSYHRCGAAEEPQTPPACPVHHELAVQRSGTTALSEQQFFCPVCNRTLKWGYIPKRCSCGDASSPYMSTTVHRAASVYTPHFVVVVNPPDPTVAANVRASGGGTRALEWVLDGMTATTAFGGQQTVSGLIDTLTKQGISLETAQDWPGRWQARVRLQIRRRSRQSSAQRGALLKTRRLASRRPSRLAALPSTNWQSRRRHR